MMKKVLFFVTILLFSLNSLAKGQNSFTEKTDPESLKIVTYNILDGFEKDTTRRNNFIKWAREYKPDILMLNELVDIKSDELAALGEEIGMPYSAQLKEEWYPVGVLSRKPIEVINKFYYPIEEVHARKGLWHGLLHARTFGIDLLVTHLSPFDTNFRLFEAEFINDYIAKQGLKNYIVAGDMNSVSPYDADYTSTQHLWADHLKAGDEKRKPWVNTAPTGTFDTRVISRFLSAGLYDPLPLFEKNPAKRSSYPTAYIQRLRNAKAQENNLTAAENKNAELNKKSDKHKRNSKKIVRDLNRKERKATQLYDDKVTEGLRRRLDYILLSESLIGRCTNANVIRLEGISDHYPVAVTLRQE